MYLETERLIIREFTPDDLDARHQLTLEAFDDDIPTDAGRQYLQWAALNHQELASLHQPPYGDRAVVLKESGQMIGSVGLVPSVIPWGVLPNHRPPNSPPHYFVSPEFGLFWAIMTAHRGQGYATEAGGALIDYVFQKLYAERIVATTEHTNAASQRVMHKLGMTLEANPGDQPVWFEVVGVLVNPSMPINLAAPGT